jgi:hypothetical protein
MESVQPDDIPPQVTGPLSDIMMREGGFSRWPTVCDLINQSGYGLVVEVARRHDCGADCPYEVGFVGRVGCTEGPSLYDYHLELPVLHNAQRLACGIDIDDLLVLERKADGSVLKTPYRLWRAWLGREFGLVVGCVRCGADLTLEDTRDKSPMRCVQKRPHQFSDRYPPIKTRSSQGG